MRSVAVAGFAIAAFAACGSANEASEAGTTSIADSVATSTSVEAPATSTTGAPSTMSTSALTSPTTTTGAPSTTTTSTPTTTTEVTPTYEFSIVEIDSDIAERMQASHRDGCPVGLGQLRYMRMSHWDFSGQVQLGEMVIHQDHADDVAAVFGSLFDAGFPIERMELVDEYGGDDDASMAANNTSGYNCREIAWRPGVWSNHALGAAIDINPLVNPYVQGDTVLPPGGAPFVDRSELGAGEIGDGDVVVTAFAAAGWEWGGHWVNSKDYQHFSAGN